MTNLQSAAFDAAAATYDADFTETTLARWLRQRVWEVLAHTFHPGDHVLELTCGTGEDALWLAGQGIHVTATDGSPEMTRITSAKATKAGLETLIQTHTLSLQHLIADDNSPPHPLIPSSPLLFDGIFSNFGGLNVLDNWRGLARRLASMVRPGGFAVLVPMGPLCPWEIAWHLAHLEPRTALRRFRSSVPARIGAQTIAVSYPSAAKLRAAFAPWFQQRALYSLGLLLPPSYLSHLVERWSGLFHRLAHLERRLLPISGGWGDHYILVLERRPEK